MRIFNIVKESIVDGPGLRTTIFFQGCTHGCLGCHNPESHDFNGGEEYSLDELIAIIESDKLSTGLTFSGGDPLDQFRSTQTGVDLSILALTFKERGRNVGLYTGYTLDQVKEILEPGKISQTALFAALDWVVTEPFIESKRSIECAFRGSTNQRVYRPEVIPPGLRKMTDPGPTFIDITEQWDKGIF